MTRHDPFSAAHARRTRGKSGIPCIVCLCRAATQRRVRRLHYVKPTEPVSSSRSSTMGSSPRSSSPAAPASPPRRCRTSSRSSTASGLLHTSVTSRSGRRATEVTLARQLGLVAGLHFSAPPPARRDRGRRRAPSSPRTTLPLALDHRHDRELDRAHAAAQRHDRVARRARSATCSPSARACPPRSTPRTGMISTPGLLRGWEGVDVAESLRAPHRASRLRRQRGEPRRTRRGARGQRAARVVAAYIRVGHTISAGLIIDGDLFRGVNGKAGQIGHVTIDENGPICRCGNRGCLDTLRRRARAARRCSASDPGMQRLRDLLQARRSRRRAARAA